MGNWYDRCRKCERFIYYFLYPKIGVVCGSPDWRKNRSEWEIVKEEIHIPKDCKFHMEVNK